jgi:hypothetical protein
MEFSYRFNWREDAELFEQTAMRMLAHRVLPKAELAPSRARLLYGEQPVN